MMNSTILRSRFIAWGLAAAFALFVMAIPEYAAARQDGNGNTGTNTARGGTLTGTVYGENQRAPVPGAMVKLRNLNNQKEYVSPPTDVNGFFKITEIEEGWYTLGVSSNLGEFNLNYGVYIKAGEVAKLSVEMRPGGTLEGKGFQSKKGFFKTPAGVLTIVALVGGAAFGIYELTKKEEEASPVR